MSTPKYLDSPEMKLAIYRLYRDFFDQAERKRRWTVADDIPWDQAGQEVDPAVADVVESFCAIELYLPDYIGKIMPEIRNNRGRAWFSFNWGYEESKHSLALGDWLLKSGFRSEEQMQDLENTLFEHEWNLPMDDVRGMVCYSATQELATWLFYRNLRNHVGVEKDPALHKLLNLVMRDERAHYAFFADVLRLHLMEDRDGTLEAIRAVINGWSMPAIHMLLDGRQRIEQVNQLGLFDERIFYEEVFTPLIDDLGITRQELRRKTKREQVSVP